MKKHIIILIVFASLGIYMKQSFAQDLNLNIGGRLQYDNISYFNEQEGKINGRNEGLLQLTIGSGTKKSTQWKGIVEVREDLSDKSRNRIWLDELWVMQRIGFADITFGKQIISWGTADGYNPVDNINPVDYSDLLDTDDEKIGIYGVRARLFFNSADVDFVWAPVGSYGKLPGTDSRWFPTASMLGLPSSLSALGMNMSVVDQLPGLTLKNGEVGVRFRKRFSGFDIALSYFNGFDHLPEYGLDTSYLFQQVPELVFDGIFYRHQVAGAEFVAVLPYGMALRGEAAYFIPEKDKPLRNEYIQAIIGIDKTFYIGNSSLMAIVEYIHDFRVVGEEYAIFDTRHIFQNALLANFELTLNNGFSLNAVSIYSIGSKDYIIRPELNYQTAGGIKFTIRGELLEGSKESFLGAYSFNDRIQCKITYSF